MWRRNTAPFERTLLEYSAKKLLPLGHGDSVLDCGSNDGTFTKKLVGKYKTVVGIDVECTGIVHNARLYNTRIEDYEPRELYDTVYMLNVLEHVEHPVEVLELIREWLGKDGCIIIQVPNALSLNRRVGVKMGILKDIYELTGMENGHRHVYDIKRLERDVAKARLRVVDKGAVFLKPFNNKQMAEIKDKKLLDALFKMADNMPEYSSPIWVKCVK
jgi:2-polyprenyl-3-methyl-5-hydroxy-6-metoxy-1,4-benzoquinol methylase